MTAEQLYRHDPRLSVRSAGIRSNAHHRVSQADVQWADVVFCMEREHKAWITAQFEEHQLPRIEVLDIPDEYEYMDPVLQEMLRLILDPEFEALLSTDEEDT